jgi:hypothetical protein
MDKLNSQFTLNLDYATRKRFKELCAVHDTTMAEETRAMIERWIEEKEKVKTVKAKA